MTRSFRVNLSFGFPSVHLATSLLCIWLNNRIKRLSREIFSQSYIYQQITKNLRESELPFSRFLKFCGSQNYLFLRLRESELPFFMPNVSQNYRSCKSELPFSLWKTPFAGVRTTFFDACGSQNYLFV